MRILFWLEPHSELSRPGVMKTWLGWFERIAETLCQTSGDVDYRIVCLDSPAASAREPNLGGRLILLSQAELLAQWRLAGNAFMQLEHDRVPKDICTQLHADLRQRLGSFEPDAVFLLNHHPWLRRGFPRALFVNIELSLTSRAPFPTFWQLDIAGAGKGRILADHVEQVLENLTLDEEAVDFIGQVRSLACNRLTRSSVEVFVTTLRKDFGSVTLLPLGIFDNFDGQTPFFAVLDKFLGEQSGESALVLTQHPWSQILSSEQVAYLADKYPYVHDGGELGSQYLLSCCDYVVGDFSTVATQALFFETQVVSIRRELSHFPVDTPLLNPLVDILAGAEAEQREKLLYWLLSRYALPEARLFDGAWLERFLRRAIEAVQAGLPWSVYEEPTATVEDWAESAWRSVPTTPVTDPEARLYLSEVVHGTPQCYTQSRSVATLYPISRQRQTLQLRMPTDLQPIACVRLDPANQPLTIIFHGLLLVTAGGTSLWRWGGGLEAFRNVGGMAVRERSDGILCVCLTDDPQFEIAFPEQVLEQVTSGTYLEIDITASPLLEGCAEVIRADDRLIAEMHADDSSPGATGHDQKRVSRFNGELESIAALLKGALSRRDQTITEQAKRLVVMKDELYRAEAQLDLLKDVMLSGREEDRL